MKRRQLKDRRLLTPYLLNHADADAIVSAGGLRGIVADLPEWCKRPGHETNVWLNAALAQLWPHLSIALSDKIGGALGKILAKITPMGVSMSFREFNLGNESLNLLSVRKAQSNSFGTGGGVRGAEAREVILDFDVRWCGDPTVVLDVVVMGLTLQVKLQELQLLGPLRVVLSSFDDKLPCFHLMKFAFVDQPRVDFALSLVGGDIEMIPGVKETVTEVIGKGLSKAIVWPKFVKVPIANKDEKPGVSRSDAGAVLEVTLVRGNGLKNARTFGKSDPFVTTRVAGSPRAAVKSSVVVGSLDPHWNETFRLIVDDPSTQSVSLAVCDYSPFADDAGVKKFGKFISKLNGACFGWSRRVRKRVYNIGGVRKSYAKGAKLDRAGTEKEDAAGSLFQSTMGTGRINLARLKPFQTVARRVVLTKSASSILSDASYARNDPRRRQKSLKAGTLDLRVRLVPLSVNVEHTQDALKRSGADAREDLIARRAGKGVVDKKTFIKKCIEKLDPNESAEARAARAAKQEAQRVAEDVERLVGSVLGGELDLNGKGSENGRKFARSDSLAAADMKRLRPHLTGLLHVTLVRGESLVAKDVNGSSDPYFKLKLKTQKWKSPTARQTLNPTYDAAAEFFVAPEDLLVPGVVVKLECWDEDIVGKDFMGEAEVPLRRVVARALRALGAEVFERVELRGVQSGAAHFKFRFQPVDVEAFRELEDEDEDEEGGEGEAREARGASAEGGRVRFVEAEEARPRGEGEAEKKKKLKTLRTTEMASARTGDVSVYKEPRGGCFGGCFGGGKKAADEFVESSDDDEAYEVEETPATPRRRK